MRLAFSPTRRRRRRGSTLFEFTISAIVLLAVILAVVEISRVVMVVTALANSARAGVRYAIVHGSLRGGTLGTWTGPSSSTSYAQVQTAARNFAGAAPLRTSALTITVNYVDTTNTPGSRVQVKVSYPYDPFLTYFSFGRINLHSMSEGVIVF